MHTVIDDTRSRVEATLDLTETRLHLADLGWTKVAGVPGKARVDLSLAGDRVSKVDRFTIVAGDLEVDGSATFAPRGLELISFRRFAYGRNDVKGHLAPRPGGGWDIDLTGSSLDLEPVLEDLTGKPDGDFDERVFGPGFSVTANPGPGSAGAGPVDGGCCRNCRSAAATSGPISCSRADSGRTRHSNSR